MREWFARLIDSFRRERLDRELQEELRFHRQQLERAGQEEGLGGDEARRRAARRLGDVTRVTENTRDRWSIPTLDHLRQDARHALRGLRRAPAFTATVVITLSLGIGANTAMFDVIDRLMFRPLAWLRDPGTVHRVYVQTIERGIARPTWWLSFSRYEDFRSWTSSFSQVAAFNERTIVIGTGESARERRIAAVTASYFDFFEARPAAGRFFGATDDTAPAGAPVVVLSHAAWLADFGGREVLGEPVQVGSAVLTIIGIAPPGLTGVDDAQPATMFVPLTTLGAVMGGPNAARFASGYDGFWGSMMVRRKPGVTVAAASADVNQAFARSWEAQRAADAQQRTAPAAEAQPTATVSGLRLGAGPTPALEARTALWVGGVAGVVLLIACANVANMLLGRAVARRRETAVRLALGVSRGRLITQFVSESVLLAAMGAAGGLVVASFARRVVSDLLLAGSTPSASLIDPRTLAVTAAVTLAAGLLTGIAPAVLAGREGLASGLRAGARGGTRTSRVRTVLVIAQAALSVVLLIGAALFVRSFTAAQNMWLGYDADRVLIVNRVLRGTPLDAAARTALRRRLLEAAQALPGVEYASWRASTPLALTGMGRFFVPGIESVQRLGNFTVQETTPDYFRVMGTRILRGRGLTSDDRAGMPRVVIVSESMARALWGDRNPLGQCLHFEARTSPCTAVIGVAEDMVQDSLTDRQHFQYYLATEQSPGDGSGMLLRLRGDPAAEADTIRRALQPLMPGASYVTVQPLRMHADRARASWRLGATMFLALAVMAVVVAAVGMYGVIAYTLGQRRHELGVRVALGARRGDVLWIAIGPGLRFAGAGAALGVGAALGGARWIEPLLFRQAAVDPVVYALVAGFMIVVALAAGVVPAARAARADPMAALRTE